MRVISSLSLSLSMVIHDCLFLYVILYPEGGCFAYAANGLAPREGRQRYHYVLSSCLMVRLVILHLTYCDLSASIGLCPPVADACTLATSLCSRYRMLRAACV